MRPEQVATHGAAARRSQPFPTYTQRFTSTRALLHAARLKGAAEVTTLPAKAGSFRAVRSPWLRQELLRLRLWQPTTLTPEGSIRARPRGLDASEEAPLSVVVLPNAGGCESDSAGEHLMRTYGTDFTRGPAPRNLQPMVHVKVLSLRTTTCVACQTAPASSADASFTSGLKPGVP